MTIINTNSPTMSAAETPQPASLVSSPRMTSGTPALSRVVRPGTIMPERPSPRSTFATRAAMPFVSVGHAT